MLGNERLKAMCFDGVTRVCNIRGSLRQQVSVDIYFTLIKIILLKYLPVLPSDWLLWILEDFKNSDLSGNINA